MPPNTQSQPDPGGPPPVAVIVSQFNRSITERLLEGAIGEYEHRGGSRQTLAIIEAPGAFELPAIADAAAETGLYRGLCCLGCIIKGETPHDKILARAVAEGLMAIALRLGTPTSFGVLTARNAEQARARAGGDKGNKGAEAMSATLDAIEAIDALDRASESGLPGVEFRLGHDPADKASEGSA